MRKYTATYKDVDELVSNYYEHGGECIQLDEGCLQSGDWILYDEGNNLKCFVITEECLNTWSSIQLIKVYKNWDNLPKKYKKQIQDFQENAA